MKKLFLHTVLPKKHDINTYRASRNEQFISPTRLRGEKAKYCSRKEP
jgi:hypothetical protein